MATWTDPATLNTDPKDPITSEYGTAVKNNPVALAEGASGAPTVEVAWHLITEYADATDSTATITFSSLDVSGYRALMILGGYNTSSVTKGKWRVDVDFATSGWTTLFEYQPSSNANIWAQATIWNVDSAMTQQVFPFWKTTYGDVSGTMNWPAADYSTGTITDDVGLVNVNEVIEGIRINPDGGTYTGSTDQATRFALYGIKRTQP